MMKPSSLGCLAHSPCSMDAGVRDLRTHRWCAAGITLRYSQITSNMLTPLSSLTVFWRYLGRSWHILASNGSWELGMFPTLIHRRLCLTMPATADVCGKRTTSPKSTRCSAMIFQQRLNNCAADRSCPSSSFSWPSFGRLDSDGCCDGWNYQHPHKTDPSPA